MGLKVQITPDVVADLDQAIHNYWQKAEDLERVQDETSALSSLLVQKTQEESQLLRIEQGALDAVSVIVERLTGAGVSQEYIDQLMSREGVPASQGVQPSAFDRSPTLPEEFESRFGTPPGEQGDERVQVIEYD